MGWIEHNRRYHDVLIPDGQFGRILVRDPDTVTVQTIYNSGNTRQLRSGLALRVAVRILIDD